MNEEEVLRWLVEYGLYTKDGAIKYIGFIKKYCSYIINYNYGLDLVKNYLEAKDGTVTATDKRWQLCGWLLSNKVTTGELKSN